MAFSCPVHNWYSLVGMCPACYQTISAPASTDIEIKTHNQKQITMTGKIKEAAEKYAFRVPYNGSNNFYNEDRYKGFMDGATSEAAREYWDAAREDEAVGFAEWVTETYYRDISGGIYNYWRDNNERIHTTKELHQLYLKHKNEKL